MSENKLDTRALLAKLNSGIDKAKKYTPLAFIIFVAVIYGFVLMRINTLSHAEPSPTASSVTTQVQAVHVAHIDENVVKQVESLQDNSVSVQALFDQARSNPFQ